MAARLSLILFTGLLIAQGLSSSLQFYERYTAAKSMLQTNLENDAAMAVAVLDSLPASERTAWLPRMERRTFRFLLSPGQAGSEVLSQRAQQMTDGIGAALDGRYLVRAETISTMPERFQVHLLLSDGQPLTIEITPSVMPIARWLPVVLAAQLLLLMLCTWVAVRLAIRPLARLASAAESLSPSGDGQRLEEGGPVEVSKAVSAFNAMQERIALHLKERLQILAAISHDLQTPITRMKLRVEAMDESVARIRMGDDLDEMQHLVRDGLAYARSAHGAAEPLLKIDLDAFLDSLVYDYQDSNKQVSLIGRIGVPVTTRPRALRRVIGNLVDNAIKYAGAAEIDATTGGDGKMIINVLDRGPGIAEQELEAVLQPFYRLEGSRNRDSGGAGLGLAIAHQLSLAMGGALTLRNREGGGLQVTLTVGQATVSQHHAAI